MLAVFTGPVVFDEMGYGRDAWIPDNAVIRRFEHVDSETIEIELVEKLEFEEGTVTSLAQLTAKRMRGASTYIYQTNVANRTYLDGRPFPQEWEGNFMLQFGATFSGPENADLEGVYYDTPEEEPTCYPFKAILTPLVRAR